MNKLDEVIAATIIQMVQNKPQQAFDAVLLLVHENTALKRRLAAAKISLGIMQTVMTSQGLDVELKAEFDKLRDALKILK